MLQLVSILKGLVEIAGLFVLAQGVLFLLAGRRRHDNVVYKLFVIITAPIYKIVRLLTPRIVLDQHLPIVAVLLLCMAWFALTASKIYLVKVQ